MTNIQEQEIYAIILSKYNLRPHSRYVAEYYNSRRVDFAELCKKLNVTIIKQPSVHSDSFKVNLIIILEI